MKILISLTYYSPHKSGVTVYAERLAETLAADGDEVTVLTSRHIKTQPKLEFINRVEVVRMPVWFRLSKGVIMPGMIFRAWRLVRTADVVNLHLPQLEGAYLAILAKIMGKKVVVTHHSDLTMPGGWFNQLAAGAAKWANKIAATLADAVVHNTLDLAQHSAFLKQYAHKWQIIPPPIVVEPVSQGQVGAFIERNAIHKGQLVIGMAARLAAEKGVEYLVDAMSEVLKVHPDARVLFAGEYQHVIGEEAYKAKMMPLIERLGEHWVSLGTDSPQDRSAFYQCIDLLVLPSINNTETFGMVQVEALMSGTPVIASDLPGVRQPALQSGFGRIVPIKDSHALAQAILETYAKFPAKVDASSYTRAFLPGVVAGCYRNLFQKILSSKRFEGQA